MPGSVNDPLLQLGPQLIAALSGVILTLGTLLWTYKREITKIKLEQSHDWQKHIYTIKLNTYTSYMTSVEKLTFNMAHVITISNKEKKLAAIDNCLVEHALLVTYGSQIAIIGSNKTIASANEVTNQYSEALGLLTHNSHFDYKYLSRIRTSAFIPFCKNCKNELDTFFQKYDLK